LEYNLKEKQFKSLEQRVYCSRKQSLQNKPTTFVSSKMSSLRLSNVQLGKSESRKNLKKASREVIAAEVSKSIEKLTQEDQVIPDDEQTDGAPAFGSESYYLASSLVSEELKPAISGSITNFRLQMALKDQQQHRSQERSRSGSRSLVLSGSQGNFVRDIQGLNDVFSDSEEKTYPNEEEESDEESNIPIRESKPTEQLPLTGGSAILRTAVLDNETNLFTGPILSSSRGASVILPPIVRDIKKSNSENSMRAGIPGISQNTDFQAKARASATLVKSDSLKEGNLPPRSSQPFAPSKHSLDASQQGINRAAETILKEARGIAKSSSLRESNIVAENDVLGANEDDGRQLDAEEQLISEGDLSDPDVASVCSDEEMQSDLGANGEII
jgi:hypothetical protein